MLVEKAECAEAIRADGWAPALLQQAAAVDWNPSSTERDIAKILLFLDVPEVRDGTLRVI